MLVCSIVMPVLSIGVLLALSPDTIMNITTGSGEKAVRLRGRILHHGDTPHLNTIGEVPLIAKSLPQSSIVGGAAGPTPRSQDGRPDFSGVWSAQRTVDRGALELLPWAQAVMAERAKNDSKDYPGAHCLPRGVTSAGKYSVYRIVQTADFLVILFEDDVVARQVFLDGRAHPDDLDPTWNGHSVGRWDGDSLLIDTIGFNDQSWISSKGEPHTARMHISERLRRPDRGHLEIERTIHDPGAYRTPWITLNTSQLLPGDEVREFVCNENNQDVDHFASSAP
jgi:hypothetical protein